MPSDESPSQIIPVLKAALVCDVGCVDPSTGKKTIVGIFDRIWAENFPTARQFTTYLRIADALGSYELEVNYLNSNDQDVLATMKGPFKAEDRLIATDLLLEMPGKLVFNKPGKYEVQVLANGNFIGGTDITVAPRQGTGGRS